MDSLVSTPGGFSAIVEALLGVVNGAPHPESKETARQKSVAISSIPGGVGIMTRVMLLKNTVIARSRTP
jgi:5,10-methylene-tetrahydrofolate dehydrogenase/methenyl tetrahydrofolate cyclohydrolase